MSEKLIIENLSDLPMVEALTLARMVVSEGKGGMTGEYPGVSTFARFGEVYAVCSYGNKKSDRLVIVKE